MKAPLNKTASHNHQQVPTQRLVILFVHSPVQVPDSHTQQARTDHIKPATTNKQPRTAVAVVITVGVVFAMAVIVVSENIYTAYAVSLKRTAKGPQEDKAWQLLILKEPECSLL